MSTKTSKRKKPRGGSNKCVFFSVEEKELIHLLLLKEVREIPETYKTRAIKDNTIKFIPTDKIPKEHQAILNLYNLFTSKINLNSFLLTKRDRQILHEIIGYEHVVVLSILSCPLTLNSRILYTHNRNLLDSIKHIIKNW